MILTIHFDTSSDQDAETVRAFLQLAQDPEVRRKLGLDTPASGPGPVEVPPAEPIPFPGSTFTDIQEDGAKWLRALCSLWRRYGIEADGYERERLRIEFQGRADELVSTPSVWAYIELVGSLEAALLAVWTPEGLGVSPAEAALAQTNSENLAAALFSMQSAREHALPAAWIHRPRRTLDER